MYASHLQLLLVSSSHSSFLQVEAVLLFNVSLTSIEECDFDVILSSYLLSGALLFQNILFMILGLSKTEWFVPCFSSLAILFNFLIFFLLALPGKLATTQLLSWPGDLTTTATKLTLSFWLTLVFARV